MEPLLTAVDCTLKLSVKNPSSVETREEGALKFYSNPLKLCPIGPFGSHFGTKKPSKLLD